MHVQLRENYLKSEPMETREETYAAIRKALATLDDPFTRLLDPARFKALQRGTAGSVTGVGLEVGFVNQGNAADSELVVSQLSGRQTSRGAVPKASVSLACHVSATALCWEPRKSVRKLHERERLFYSFSSCGLTLVLT